MDAGKRVGGALEVKKVEEGVRFRGRVELEPDHTISHQCSDCCDLHPKKALQI
jgi:hypothetical protein